MRSEDFDLETVDGLLTTTRSVRRRLDLERPVPDRVLMECLGLALQAPTGSNLQGWRFVVVTDPGRRRALARLYRHAWDEYAKNPNVSGIDARTRRQTDDRNTRVRDSAQWLAEHLQEVPVHVVPCYGGRRLDGSTAASAGLFASVMPAVWSLLLALRSRGLGGTITTLHLRHEAEAAAVLGLPDDVVQCCLLPVAWTAGTDFGPARRRPAEEVVFWDRWGDRRGSTAGGEE